MDTKIKTKLTDEEFNQVLEAFDVLINEVERIANIAMNKQLLFEKDSAFVKKSVATLKSVYIQADLVTFDYTHLLSMCVLNACKRAQLQARYTKLLDARNLSKRIVRILNHYSTLIGEIKSNKGTFKLNILCKNKELTVQM